MTHPEKSHPAVNFVDLREQKFNHLTVISRASNSKYGQARWLCKCDCGSNKDVITNCHRLKTGHTKSCGCLGIIASAINGRKNRKEPFRWAYTSMTRAATLRGRLDGFMTFEQFLEFTKTKECYYCGEDVHWHPYCSFKSRGAYKLDRKDNSKGYQVENCVVCCRNCNFMKQGLSAEEFVAHCRKVAAFNKTC